ncbi:hypothetical protein Barb6XT_00915 [Bacteroidales bacterium Barb6XT]|nr:hypothetical protein Barb6XT_00915 [Bacteroidales bacterium Barb6XT]
MQKSVCKWMLLSLCSWMFLASCTDSDYDLNDVTKDGMVIGEVLSGGLGHGSISAEKFLNADKIDGLTVIDGKYVISYKDSVKVSLDYDVPAGAIGDLGRTFPIIKQSVKLKGLDELFQGTDNWLSFTDPHIKLTTYSNAGTPLSIDLTFESENSRGNKMKASVSNILTKTPASPSPLIDTTKIWIGGDPQAAEKEPGYTFEQNKELNNLLSITPSLINISGNVKTDATPSYKNAYTKIAYEVEVPLAPSSDFRAQISETMEDVFSEDLIDLLFASGEVVLWGTVSNGMPLDLSLNLIITDEKGKPVGIDFKKQAIGSFASKAPVSFTITENDIRKKMAEAKGIILEFEATGSEKAEGRCIRPDQKVELVLNFKKTGGIAIDKL